VRSRTTERFRRTLVNLPPQIRAQAREAYRHFQNDPAYPSLHFKQVHSSLPIYSVRIGKGYRAVGQRDEKGILWFWIGSHAEYDKLLSQL
jgi:mRNA-degrading endonuclease RelE of RelBE toxin-antitoxin system